MHCEGGKRRLASQPYQPFIHISVLWTSLLWMRRQRHAIYTHFIWTPVLWSNPYQPSIHKSISACFIRLEQRKKHFVVYVLNLEPHPFFFFNHRKERRKKGKWGLCCISPHCQQSIMGGGREVGIWLQITMGRKQIMAINLHQHKNTTGRKQIENKYKIQCRQNN